MSEIFIVEDDENIRGVVKYALESANFCVADFESSKGFWNEIDNRTPSLCILDIMLPDEDGITILKKIKQNKKTKDIPVILLTAKDKEYDKVKGLDIGADDYITKPFSVLELISRVKALLRRVEKKERKENIIEIENVILNIEKHSVLVGKNNVTLTYKEFELLKLLMENKGLVLTREKIMDIIWGTDFQGESRTVDMHIKTLREKLGMGNKFIKTVRSVGYKVGE